MSRFSLQDASIYVVLFVVCLVGWNGTGGASYALWWVVLATALILALSLFSSSPLLTRLYGMGEDEKAYMAIALLLLVAFSASSAAWLLGRAIRHFAGAPLM